MNCSKCGTGAHVMRFPKDAVVLFMPNHADGEKLAWHCSKCKKWFCGVCCLPGWEALKKKEGLSGPALAAKLEADPNAVFSEMPHCPECGATTSLEGPAPSGCFIATAACGGELAPEVVRLRAFRDRRLSRSRWGQAMIAAYERCSPPVAAIIRDRPRVQALVRAFLISPASRLASLADRTPHDRG